MRVLILREAEAAAAAIAELRRRGHDPVLVPLERTVELDAPPPAAEFQAIAATSARAVPAVSRGFFGDLRPFLAVGEATGRAAAAAGFSDVRTGKGKAESLVEVAAAAGLPAGSTILYAAGRNRTGTLEKSFERAGFRLVVWEVYDMEALNPGEEEVAEIIGGSPIDAVLLFSAAQARGFGAFFGRFEAHFERFPRLFCLSERIAEALPAVMRARVAISPEPNLDLLLDMLDR